MTLISLGSPGRLFISSELRVFYYAALKNGHVCGFFKESRMKFLDGTKADRKSAQQQPTRFRLPAFSSAHTASCASPANLDNSRF
jgi:hypothetical protein